MLTVGPLCRPLSRQVVPLTPKRFLDPIPITQQQQQHQKDFLAITSSKYLALVYHCSYSTYITKKLHLSVIPLRDRFLLSKCLH